MRRVLFLLILCIIVQSSTLAAPKKMIPAPSDGTELLPNIFIYEIPDNDETNDNDSEEQDGLESDYITPIASDDEDEIILEQDTSIIGAATLKGYNQYIEDSNAIYLKDSDNNFVLNIKSPQKIYGSKRLNFITEETKPLLRYMDAEYVIAPNTIQTTSKIGNFTIGAQFNHEVDNIAMLETETGLFTKYEKNKFALSSSVTKSLNTTYALDYNTISLAPELKFNDYLSLKNVFSADVTRNRQSSKLVFSVNPFGKDRDRFSFELGAKETYNAETENSATQFSFTTQFKL